VQSGLVVDWRSIVYSLSEWGSSLDNSGNGAVGETALRHQLWITENGLYQADHQSGKFTSGKSPHPHVYVALWEISFCQKLTKPSLQSLMRSIIQEASEACWWVCLKILIVNHPCQDSPHQSLSEGSFYGICLVNFVKYWLKLTLF
jgi:hypothetical protein